MAVSVFKVGLRGQLSFFFFSQVLSIGPPIPVPPDQPTGQQTRQGPVAAAGVPRLRMLCGNLMAELLWDRVVSLFFIPDLFVTSAARARICM